MRLPIQLAMLACAAMHATAEPAAAGKEIFEGKGNCVRCHSVANRGGSLGPDLTEIGIQRTPASLRLSITDPDAEIRKEFLTVIVTTAQGRRIEGIVLNEDDISIQVRDTDGNPRSFLKQNLQSVHREQRSLMPQFTSRLSSREIDDLVAYLRSLRGSAGESAGGERQKHKRQPGPLTTDTAWLTRANRDAQERPETLLDSLAIAKGATVVDLGAGAGYFTWRLAQRVGLKGKVLAVDIQRGMLDRIAQELQQRRLSNVELILATDRDPRLPEEAVDLVLIANAYHEFTEPEAVMSAVRRCLKPGGRVVVIEYAEEKDDPVAGLYTMGLDELRSEIEGMGFHLDLVLDFLPMQHGLIFSR